MNTRTRLLTGTQAAAQLGISEGTLRNLRSRNEGPDYVKEANRVYYTQTAIEDWRRARTTVVKPRGRA